MIHRFPTVWSSEISTKLLSSRFAVNSPQARPTPESLNSNLSRNPWEWMHLETSWLPPLEYRNFMLIVSQSVTVARVRKHTLVVGNVSYLQCVSKSFPRYSRIQRCQISTDCQNSFTVTKLEVFLIRTLTVYKCLVTCWSWEHYCAVWWNTLIYMLSKKLDWKHGLWYCETVKLYLHSAHKTLPSTLDCNFG